MPLYSEVDFSNPTEASKWAQEVRNIIEIYELYNKVGSGTPLNNVVAPLGAIYHNTSGGANTSIYVKETEVTTPDSSGWTPK